jgi:CheY-like chemotaxis protein
MLVEKESSAAVPGTNLQESAGSAESTAVEKDRQGQKGEESEANAAQIPTPTYDMPNAQDESKNTGNLANATINPGRSEKWQTSQSSQARKSGSEAMEKTINSSLTLRTQMNRATTAPCASNGIVSLLLVDDNVSKQPTRSPLLPSPTNHPSEQALNLRLLEVFAKRAGHAYRTAQNGQEAVESYERSADQQRATDSSEHDPNFKLIAKPDVILMDINMPILDGFEATRAIRRFENSSGCPRATIVAVTGLGDVTAQEEAFASGMDLFLTKPVKMKEVNAMLSNLRVVES